MIETESANSIVFADFVLQLPSGFKVEGHILKKDDEPIGIICPSLLISLPDDSSPYIRLYGPRGSVVLEPNDANGNIAAILSIGGVILGAAASIEIVASYLSHPRLSRTVSYWMSVSSSCDQILKGVRLIREASIAVVGCGGIGSIAAMLLVGAGVDKVTLFDGDKVEESNFNRQLFWTLADIGSYKVDVLKRAIHARNSEVDIKVNKTSVLHSNFTSKLSSFDSLFFTADEPIGLASEVRTWASRYQKKSVFAGYTFRDAIVSTEYELLSQGPGKFHPLNSAIMPSNGPSNAMIAGVATQHLLNRIGGFEVNSATLLSWNFDLLLKRFSDNSIDGLIS